MLQLTLCINHTARNVVFTLLLEILADFQLFILPTKVLHFATGDNMNIIVTNSEKSADL